MATTVGESLHESARPAHPPTVPRWVNIAGWICTILPALALLMSGGVKLMGGPTPEKMMTDLGITPDLLVPLGVFEVTCVLLYLAPATSILAAILLTAYLGGATLAHVRVHEQFVPQVVIGLLLWLGIFFRDYRVRQLLPLRRGKA